MIAALIWQHGLVLLESTGLYCTHRQHFPFGRAEDRGEDFPIKLLALMLDKATLLRQFSVLTVTE